MKLRFTAILFLTLINLVKGGELLLSGFYQGKNIYVQNPFNIETKEFCTEEVYVNDIKVLSSIKNSAFTINLSNLQLNSPVHIKITYKEDCAPRIINALAIKKDEEIYSFKNVSIREDLLTWTLNESPSAGKFIIEKYIENYWKPIATTAANNEKNIFQYLIQKDVAPGLNKFRIKYLSPKGQTFFSANVAITGKESPDALSFENTTDKILLSRESPYEILDADGKKIEDGRGKEILIAHLNPGIYYLNIDNKTERFQKK